MSMEQELRMAIVRCLSLLRRYHDGGRTAAAKAKMSLEVEVLVGWLMGLDLPAGVTGSGILKPVEARLTALYGDDIGRKLNRDFSQVFAGAGMPLLHLPNYKHLAAFDNIERG